MLCVQKLSEEDRHVRVSARTARVMWHKSNLALIINSRQMGQIPQKVYAGPGMWQIMHGERVEREPITEVRVRAPMQRGLKQSAWWE